MPAITSLSARALVAVLTAGLWAACGALGQGATEEAPVADRNVLPMVRFMAGECAPFVTGLKLWNRDAWGTGVLISD